MPRLLVFPSKSLPASSGPVNPTLQAIRDMAENEWMGLPSTNPSAVTPSPVPPGHGPGAVTENWCGGVFIPGTPDYFCIWGGGHNGYAGNELYGFDLTTFAWSLLIQPTPNAQIIENVDTYADGAPSSRHTYGAPTHDTNGNLISCTGSACYGSLAPQDPRVRRGNLPAGTWTDFNDNYTALGSLVSGAFTVHPVTGEVWGIGTGGLAPFSRYIIGSGWTHYLGGAPTSSNAYAVFAIDPTQDLACYNATSAFLVWDIGTGVQPQVFTQPTISGSGSLLTSGYAGHEWRSVDGKNYCWHGGDEVQRYTPHRTAVTVQSITGGGGDTPPAAEPTGTYGRWRYWPAEDRFVCLSNYYDNVFIWRPPA